MVEVREADINIEEVKTRIRKTVERRESEGFASAKISREVLPLLLADRPSLEALLIASLPPPEVVTMVPEVSAELLAARQPDRRYHISELLKYDDEEFVWKAYVALLKREPDEDGFQSHLKALRSGDASKLDILARVRYSPEGRRQGVPIDGLLLRALASKGRRLLKRNANRDPESQPHNG